MLLSKALLDGCRQLGAKGQYIHLHCVCAVNSTISVSFSLSSFLLGCLVGKMWSSSCDCRSTWQSRLLQGPGCCLLKGGRFWFFSPWKHSRRLRPQDVSLGGWVLTLLANPLLPVQAEKMPLLALRAIGRAVKLLPLADAVHG